MTHPGGSSPQSPELPPRPRYALSGPAAKIDPARDMVRADLADVALAGRVFAPHYAAAIARRIACDTDVFPSGKAEGTAAAQLKAGEAVEVFDISGGWAWIRTATAIGYVRADAVAPA